MFRCVKLSSCLFKFSSRVGAHCLYLTVGEVLHFNEPPRRKQNGKNDNNIIAYSAKSIVCFHLNSSAQPVCVVICHKLLVVQKLPTGTKVQRVLGYPSTGGRTTGDDASSSWSFRFSSFCIGAVHVLFKLSSQSHLSRNVSFKRTNLFKRAH